MTNDHRTCRSNNPALNIHLGLPYRSNERLNFVEHVLEVLNESRTGRPRIYRMAELSCEIWEFQIDLPDHLYNLTERLRIHVQRFLSIARSANNSRERLYVTLVERAKFIPSLVGSEIIASLFEFAECSTSLPPPRGSP
jgi:hypothetical protein